MKVLVINCGSSSIKYQLYDADVEQVLAKGVVARIGEEGSYLKHEAGDVKLQKEMPAPSHRTGFELVVESLLDQNYGVIKDLSEVSAVGHRAVHGGDTFIESIVITEDVIEKMEAYIPLAPLHNPANLIGIREAKRILPNVPHVAVFDTAYHQTMPPKAYLYALPYEYYETHKIRRYGFHGTSCRYIAQRMAEVLKQPLKDVKMVICHLGNGVTIAAIDGGKSVDTSLGFTPVPGVMMGTRCGDIDPGLILYLNRQLGLSLDRIDDILNRESGLLGVSGVTNDMRQIINNSGRSNQRCQLAMEMFVYHVKKYIGAYAAAMGGIDTLVFTAGIGENSSLTRAMICEGLGFLGIELDEIKNNETLGMEQTISSSNSIVKVLVIPTNEERMIALDTITLAFPSFE
ncbi:acetate/propionate family kinase [Chloroflexota bacterium]